MTEIGGAVEPGFEAVADAFRANFEQHGEVGAATAVYVGGRKVVDLWGGVADVDAGTPYTEDSLQLVFSTTKGATAACANLLAQRGELDMDAPVAEYWPEFKAAGKADIPVRWLLCHKAGLPYVDATLTLEEALAWEPMIRALEAQAPVWEPGTRARLPRHHLRLAGRRGGEAHLGQEPRAPSSTTRSPAPLGLEFWIGLPDEQQHRVAPLIQWGGSAAWRIERPATRPWPSSSSSSSGPTPCSARRSGRPTACSPPPEGGFNNPAVRAAEIPAANGVTNARSLARFYAGLTGTVEGGPPAPILDPGPGGQGLGAADPGPRQVPHVRDDLRARVLRRVAVRALRRARVLRAHRRRAARWASPTRSTASASGT